MGTLGKTALAAHQIAVQCVNYNHMVSLGLSIAVLVRVGEVIGRRNPTGARRVGWLGMGLGAGSMLIAALSC